MKRSPSGVKPSSAGTLWTSWIQSPSHDTQVASAIGSTPEGWCPVLSGKSRAGDRRLYGIA